MVLAFQLPIYITQFGIGFDYQMTVSGTRLVFHMIVCES